MIRQYRSVFMVIFGISAVGMVVSMFGSDRAGGGMGVLDGGAAASVEGSEISSRELREALSRQLQDAERFVNEQMKSAGGNPENRKFLEQMVRAQVTPDRVLGQLIQQRFMETTAEKAGFVVAPESVRQLIQSETAFHKDGRFDPVLYRQMVAEPGLYEKELGRRAVISQFSQVFHDGLGYQSPEEARLEKELRAKRVYETVSVSPRSFPSPKSVSKEEAEAFAKDAANQPKLQSYFDRHLSRFQKEEEIRARHILVKDDAEGEKKIRGLLADIRGGKLSFEDAAKQHSEDKSNAAQGGDLNYFARGVMDPAFESAAFSLKDAKQISEPVKSSFGWHLIQLEDRRAASKKTLADVQAEIAPEVLLEERRTAEAKRFVEGLVSSGKAPTEKDLKAYGLAWQKQPAWSPLDPAPGPLAGAESRLSEVLALSKEKPLLASPLSSGDSLVLVRLVEVQPAEEVGSNEKTDEAFQFFLRNRYEALEKAQKIRRSEKVIGQLRQQLALQQGQGR